MQVKLAWDVKTDTHVDASFKIELPSVGDKLVEMLFIEFKLRPSYHVVYNQLDTSCYVSVWLKEANKNDFE